MHERGMPHHVVIKNQAIKLVSEFIIFVVVVVVVFRFLSFRLPPHILSHFRWLLEVETVRALEFRITRQIEYKEPPFSIVRSSLHILCAHQLPIGINAISILSQLWVLWFIARCPHARVKNFTSFCLTDRPLQQSKGFLFLAANRTYGISNQICEQRVIYRVSRVMRWLVFIFTSANPFWFHCKSI